MLSRAWLVVAQNTNALNTSEVLLLVGCELWYEAATVTAVGLASVVEGSDRCGVGSRQVARKRQQICGY